MKVALVGGPAYFALRRPPRTSDDLARHSGVQYRLAVGGGMLACPLYGNGKTRRITVAGPLMVNDADGHARGSRQARHRTHAGSLGRTVSVSATTGPSAGGLVAIVRGILRLLSWASACPGQPARLHRHTPRRPQLGAGRGFTQEPLYPRLSDPKSRQESPSSATTSTQIKNCMTWQTRPARSPPPRPTRVQPPSTLH
jgi:hypothetical protein